MLPVSAAFSNVAWYIIHLEAKPLNGGMPLIESAPIMNSAAVCGIFLARPPNFSR